MTPRLLLSTLFAACLSTTCLGQSGLDRAILSAAAPLTEAQKSAVNGFIAKPVDAIKDSDSSTAIEEARATLVTPSRDPSSTPTFRKAYAVALMAELGPVLKGRDTRRAINAMQVLRFTRTQEALDAILERTAPANESDATKRIAAASLAADAFEDLDAGNAYFETAARRLKEAAIAEGDPIALQQKFAAISAASKRKDLPADNARNVRRNLVEAIAAISKSIRASSKADGRVKPMLRALVSVRNDMLEMNQSERAAVSKALAPALVDLLAAGASHWSDAHADAALSQNYGSVTNICEVLLRLIDRAERPSAYAGSKPDGDSRILTPAWDAKDKSKFDSETKRWSDIVSAAPYKG
jgi:hypothetical protein